MAFFSNKKHLTVKFRFIELLWQQLPSFYAPISCFHQGPKDRQTPGELKKMQIYPVKFPSQGWKTVVKFPAQGATDCGQFSVIKSILTTK